MSGTIFPAALETAEELESTKWNPLQCNICTEQYRDPCLLRCYHSFCAKCVEPKVEDGKLCCPVCSTITMIKEGFTVPPADLLLKFLVESSTGDKLLCANCDKSESQMYFCNTCSQPLCSSCREDTHRARMFQTHEIVPQTKHTRDIQKQCKIHGEPYILFSTEKKLMLCINCFRDMKVESRSHCVDLETAYKQGCQKLDDMMQSIRDLQSTVRDSILLLRALLEDIALNAEKEKKDINELYSTVQEKISETKAALLKEIERQYAEKEELFKNQLDNLVIFLPTLHVHLVTCGAFSSSADKFEFLDFTHSLTKRLTAIIQIQQPLHPTETSDIITEYKAKFAKCLEPLLFPPRNAPTTATPVSMATSAASMRYDPSPTINSTAQSKPEMLVSPHSQLVGNRYSHTKTKQFKMKLMETKGFFSDHCKEFDDAHRRLMQKVEGLKLSVQELQRDITLRRSLTKDGFITDLRKQIGEAEEQLEQHKTHVESKQNGLEQHWEESLERIAGEQEVYQAQLQDVGRLKMEVVSVNTILQKLSSFVSSIANVTQRLAPKLGQASTLLEQDSQHAALFKEITTMQPDSQQRVEAIRSAQEERDIKSANRVNPLDEELIKTKGLLRTPSARKDSSNRASVEIQEAIAAEAERERGKMKAENKEQLESKESEETENIVSVDKTVNSASGISAVGDNNTNENVKHVDKSEQVNDPAIMIEESESSEISNGNSDTLSDQTKENKIPDITIDRSMLPDLTKELNGYGSENSYSSDEESKAKPFKDRAMVNEVTESEICCINDSDLDTSTDSAVSTDESFKQGHVRDIIAKVDSWTKSGNVLESPEKSTQPDVKEKVLCAKNTTDKAEPEENGHMNGNDKVQQHDCTAAKTKMEESKVDTDDINAEKDLNDNDGAIKPDVCEEDVYVAKSLPELAQVFEPGELKQKKRRSKSDKHKNK